MTIIAYKVVNKIDNKMVSLNASKNFMFPYFLEYEINKKTLPRIGKIFVFNTLKNATYYMKYKNFPFSIIKGKAENPQRIRLVSLFTMNKDSIEEFWENRGRRKSQNLRSFVPRGTIICDSFTPTEIIIEK